MYFLISDKVPESQSIHGFSSYDYGGGSYDTGFDDKGGFDYYR